MREKMKHFDLLEVNFLLILKEIKNMLCTYNGYYSALRQKEILQYATMWINLWVVLLSEISQS